MKRRLNYESSDRILVFKGREVNFEGYSTLIKSLQKIFHEYSKNVEKEDWAAPFGGAWSHCEKYKIGKEIVDFSYDHFHDNEDYTEHIEIRIPSDISVTTEIELVRDLFRAFPNLKTKHLDDRA